jgi:hypothetical protein
MDDLRANVAAYRSRIAAAPNAPVAGGSRSSTSGAAPAGDASPTPVHGLAGTDEAGSGGDD